MKNFVYESIDWASSKTYLSFGIFYEKKHTIIKNQYFNYMLIFIMLQISTLYMKPL